MTREQMIDKMARMLCYQQDVGNCTECYRYNSCLYRLTAKEIYNAGFRKQSEGEWVPVSCEPYGNGLSEETWYKCSLCGKYALGWCDDEYYADPQKTKYCPHCGARIRGAE